MSSIHKAVVASIKAYTGFCTRHPIQAKKFIDSHGNVTIVLHR